MSGIPNKFILEVNGSSKKAIKEREKIWLSPDPNPDLHLR